MTILHQPSCCKELLEKGRDATSLPFESGTTVAFLLSRPQKRLIHGVLKYSYHNSPNQTSDDVQVLQRFDDFSLHNPIPVKFPDDLPLP